MKSNDHVEMRTILKANWERYRHHVPLSRSQIRILVAPVCIDIITDVNILSGGCANTNYKIQFENEAPLVLRIYTRDASALDRERDIHRLLEGKIPIARMLFADESQKNLNYPFAILSHVDGILLRDLIFAGDNEAISSCYFQAGELLAILSTFTFLEGGFFEKNLHIRPFSQKEAYLNLALSLLKSSTIKRDFGLELIKRVRMLIMSAEHYLPKNTTAFLTHGDFDPSNIKVINANGSWHISGILDWEFAYAGTYFLDIGLMVRYSHKLPSSYETAFINGIRQGGLELSFSWKRHAKLMDLLCLLQLAHSNPKHKRPIINSNVRELISNTLDHWDSY